MSLYCCSCSCGHVVIVTAVVVAIVSIVAAILVSTILIAFMVVLVLSLLQLRLQLGKHCQLQMPCLFLLREPLAWPQTRRHG